MDDNLDTIVFSEVLVLEANYPRILFTSQLLRSFPLLKYFHLSSQGVNICVLYDLCYPESYRYKKVAVPVFSLFYVDHNQTSKLHSLYMFSNNMYLPHKSEDEY